MRLFKRLLKAVIFTVAGCAMTVAWFIIVLMILITGWVIYVWSMS